MENILKKHPKLINSTKEDGYTGFHLATLNGHLNTVDFLIRKNIDIEIVNNLKQTALMIAVGNLCIPIMDLLIEKSLFSLNYMAFILIALI